MGVTMAAMAILFIFIALALPIFISIIFFVGFIYLGIFSFVYTGEFWIYEDKLEEKLTPRISFTPFLKPRHTYYYWAELESYLLDADLNYGAKKERRYLKLYFANPKREVAINEGNDTETRTQFVAFVTAFEALTKTEPPQPVLPNSNAILNSSKPQPVISAKRRKNFYQRPVGKLLALFFIVLTGILLVVYYFPSLIGIEKISYTSAWKIWAVLIPGTIYISLRAFGNKA